MIFARGDWFYLLLTAMVAVFMARPYLYAVQQDNYRISMIFSNRRVRLAFMIDLIAVTVFMLFWTGCYFVASRVFWGFLISVFFFITEFALYFVEEIPDKKKPLRYTKRAVRAIAANVLAATGAMCLAIMFFNARVEDKYLRYLLFFAVPILFPALFCVVTSLVNVFERANNLRYERRTRKILASRPDVIKIAITGSYGKTSVKKALEAMLSSKFRVLATPESYNTPMGVSKTVKNLDGTHEVFIAEMGARRTGDIKRLMRIVNPDISVLTGINSQHLETFGSLDGIIREKCRVLNVAAGGFSVVADRLRGLKELEKYADKCLVFAGSSPESDFSYSDIAAGEDGSAFIMRLKGVEQLFTTPLLGRHNIENLTLAAAVAGSLGVRPPALAAAADAMSPVPHRLQLIHGDGIRIIDDSFNANPDGAAAALEVLGLFSGRKVVLTPGMVELGELENEENFKLGTALAAVADAVLLVGKKRTEAIARGLERAGFAGVVKTYASLDEAKADFKNTLHLNDVLLILNDLPDVYDE